MALTSTSSQAKGPVTDGVISAAYPARATTPARVEKFRERLEYVERVIEAIKLASQAMAGLSLDNSLAKEAQAQFLSQNEEEQKRWQALVDLYVPLIEDASQEISDLVKLHTAAAGLTNGPR